MHPGNGTATSEQIEHLLATGNLSAAESLSRSLLERRPDDLEALFLLGVCLARRLEWEGAADCFSRACRSAPAIPVLWKNLGIVRQELGDTRGARDCFQQALAIDSRDAELWVSLASVHVVGYAYDRAAECYRHALKLGPSDPAEILNCLATLQVYLGDTGRALNTFEQAISLAPTHVQRLLYSQNRLLTLHYPAHVEPETIAQAHRVWGETFFQGPAACGFSNEPRPDRRLRIGYVSPDFRMNAVSFFIQPVLANHDPARVELFCYANVKQPDEVTRRLREDLRLTWRDITSLDDVQACALIRQDRIDILVDLTGHGADNRLPLCALRPAPVQVTWIGYPDTTGLATIDYRITDAIADPPGMTEHLHTEQLLRLPGCFLCYNPGAEFPAVAPPSCEANDVITFGSMSNFSKITPQLLDIWADLLLRVHGSRLVLRYRGQERERIARDMGGHLERKGVAADRLELLGHASSVVEQLGGYQRMDIALDTFPYNGTTTTCEALWMGVPVVTLAGRTHVSRVGASLLTTVGLPQFIAETPEEYIEKSVALAMNRPLQAALRNRLRGMVSASPLCDHRRFARQVEDAYRTVWARWCAGQERGRT
ncbi:O-linked N-acetylglucosamine transferase, SPINDLY family protein [Geobacter argillaceus]|uniref:protein O-GlcNAc transferase n=1 Tax=Geobacter argillaceus TaxID=345631 RepID=A0A562VLV1_9BACT|nr:glycosyltransferase family 41 protein [Geobacter argillaceus]TWJ18870.1 putative O-linked N-acetylglucosamine transferase (SPINDLY family) [Geobacter argillaceus]